MHDRERLDLRAGAPAADRAENFMTDLSFGLPLGLLALTALLVLAQLILMLQQTARGAALERRLHDAQEALRAQLLRLDQGLRQEIATGTRSGLEAAFDKVQAGMQAQAQSLAEFGRFQREAIDQSLRVFGEQQRERLAQAEKTAREGNEAIKEVLGAFRAQVSALEASLREEQEKLRNQVAERLEAMRAGNEAKLDDMRRTVDEKLQSALEKQLKDSFANLQEQLGAVMQAIGQVQNVAGEVGDLKRLFSNVKSRGGWGEAQLEAMLTDLLPSGAFEKNFRVKEASGELVEFALRVPGRGGEHAWLPIDSKFPTEDYARLLAANEAGLREEEAAARAALGRNLRMEAAKIRDKYILPPRTLDVGILYLPSDSLFAEVARIPGLIEAIRRDAKVMVMGPSLLPAFLHTLNVSYATVALEQNASKIQEMLSAVKKEWGKFGDALNAIEKHANNISKEINSTKVRQRAIDRSLRQVTVIENVQSDLILGLDDQLVLAAAGAAEEG
jgi:DNA recombination protein RmuC